MEDLSQEEIELLMSGMLSEDKSNEIFDKKEHEHRAVQEDISPVTDLREEKNVEREAEKSIEDNDSVKNSPNQNTVTAKEIKKDKNNFIKNIIDKIKSAKQNNTSIKENTGMQKFFIGDTVTASNQINTSVLVKVVVVLTVLVVIMSILFISQLYRKNQLVKDEITVTIPSYKANTTNYIFVSEKKMFKQEPLELVKMLVDPVATLFYFDKPMDFMLYEASLKDKEGKSYTMDLSFTQSNEEDKMPNYVRFEPIDNTVKELTLTISDPYTGDAVDYNIVFKSTPKILAAKYIPQPMTTDNSSADMQMVLENAVFSGAGSYIEYRLSWKEHSEILKLGWQGIDSNDLVNILENNVALPRTNANPLMYAYENDNTVLGRIDFSAVKNLNSKVNVIFKNLYIQKETSQKLDLTSILFNGSQDESNYKTINLGQYNLVLERFGDFGDNCELVYHLEDVATKTHLEARLVSELSISDGSGMEVLIKGTCMAKEEGGGVFFDIQNSKEILKQFNNKSYTLHLTDVGVKFPDQSFTLDLSQLDDTTLQVDKESVKNFVIESFTKRLSVKSGQADQKELEQYFNRNVLKEESIIRDYLQPVTLIEPADYSSQIITMGKNNDSTYYVVVQDSWKGNEGIKEVHFYRTHKITVKNVDGQYKITEDIIIK